MNKILYFSPSERSISMWFSTVCSSTYLHLYAQKKVCNFNDKNPNNNMRIQRNALFKMVNFPVKNVRDEKRDNDNWTKSP